MCQEGYCLLLYDIEEKPFRGPVLPEDEISARMQSVKVIFTVLLIIIGM